MIVTFLDQLAIRTLLLPLQKREKTGSRSTWPCSSSSVTSNAYSEMSLTTLLVMTEKEIGLLYPVARIAHHRVGNTSLLEGSDLFEC